MPTAAPSTLTTRDGRTLALHDWAPSAAQGRRATALLVHGLGEHAGRYGPVAQRLNACGLQVRGYDQHGHGASGGARGALARDDQLPDDLAQVLDATRAGMPAGEPLVLVGHSMGGLVAADFVARGLRPVDALVLSSPALAAFLNPLQKLLLATLPRLLPNLRVGNGLDADGLSHDAQVVAAYRADPLCHDRISARLARYIATGGAPVVAAAPRWRVPTLLMWGEQDRIVNPAGARAFAAAAPADVLTARGFAGLRHEIFNELQAEPVFTLLQDWLARRGWAGVWAKNG
ncbi:alpha/beta hydrolase [Pulveribacter suum]|uniref:Alpha/beta hydrolase n=1 Tax=Pulveribacter suum TaxID=2116657 RepID=A0A2P1NH09_9BURK|nr:alpha/beta hydrolase [Pulveribacter suum]AVP56341.1 alpha/beta hydrolase [Pulveribacter suum]